MANTAIQITVDIGDIEKLGPWANNLKIKTVQANQQIYKEALMVIQQNQRVRTGYMRDNTKVFNNANGADIIAAAPYSGYQNFGTQYMSGTHFMEKGMAYIQQNIPSALTKILSVI